MSPHMRRAVKYLADGEWHDRDLVIADMAKAIPPGPAVRYVETSRLRVRAARIKKGLPVKETDARRDKRSADFLVNSGRRGIALHALSIARRIEHEKRDGKTWVRLRPPKRHPRLRPTDDVPAVGSAEQAPSD